MRGLPIVLITLLAAGCQTTAHDPNSPYFLVSAGSRLVLNEPLTIPASRASVFIQDGKIISTLNGVNQYYPYCRLETNTVRDSATRIAPDTFIVTRANRRIDYVGIDVQFALVGGDDAGTGFWTPVTSLSLHSATQPDVRSLACQYWDYPARARHVTLAEIRATLATVFTLLRAGDAGSSRPVAAPNP